MRLKVLVTGSRNPSSETRLIVREFVAGLRQLVGDGREVVVLSGGAVGVDALVCELCAEYSLPCLVCRPDYERYGRRAPMVRNREMVVDAGSCVAFGSAEGLTPGTAGTVELARCYLLPVNIVSDASSLVGALRATETMLYAPDLWEDVPF